MDKRTIPGQMNPPLPAFWFQPVLELHKPDPRYVAPLYKTSERAGTVLHIIYNSIWSN